MGIVTRHGLYAAQIGATVLNGITAVDVKLGTQVRSEASSGEVYARHQAIVGQKSTGGFASRAIASALGLVGLAGASLADLSGGLKLFAQKRADGGTRTGGSAHRKFTFVKGLVYPTNLTLDHQGDAVVSYDVLPVYDGANDPVAVTDSVALPAITADSERFGLGPFSMEGVATGQLSHLAINFGIAAKGEGADGEIWDTFSSIEQIAPSITLRGTDITWWAAGNVPTAGKSLSHALTNFYLRKRAVGGTFIANNVANHIKFTACGLAVIDDGFTAGGELSISIPLRYDGTNAPLLVNLASEIT